MLRTGHLFAGGGGGLYADLILGHSPVFAVEWDPYACEILRSRAADGWFPGLRVHEGDARLFDPSEYASRVDCIHAGFPCQDISLAGGGAGISGARSGLYREVLRVADAIRPRYLFLENVGAIVSRGLGTVLGDLAARGYDARWTCLSAAEVGAPHKRDRWWCLAESGSERFKRREGNTEGHKSHRHASGRAEGYDGSFSKSKRRGVGITANPYSYRQQQPGRDHPEGGRRIGYSGEDVADAHKIGWDGRPGEQRTGWRGESENGRWWELEPDVGRLVNGMAARSHQIRALGNGQVPLCAAAAWKILGGE